MGMDEYVRMKGSGEGWGGVERTVIRGSVVQFWRNYVLERDE
jgi:hypothetical protein